MKAPATSGTKHTHVYFGQYAEQQGRRHAARYGEDAAFRITGIHPQAYGQVETHGGQQAVVYPHGIGIIVRQIADPEVVENDDGTHQQGCEDKF